MGITGKHGRAAMPGEIVVLPLKGYIFRKNKRTTVLERKLWSLECAGVGFSQDLFLPLIPT